MVAVAQRSRRQVVALKIEGSIPSSHPKSTKGGKFQITNTNTFAKSQYTLLRKYYSLVTKKILISEIKNWLRFTVDSQSALRR